MILKKWFSWAVMLFIFAMWAGTAQAETVGPYAYGGIGQASADLTPKPGLWRHEGQPYNTDLTDLSFKAGLGWKWASGFFTEVGLVDPGTFHIQSQFTSDKNYDQQTGACKKHCNELHELNLHNSMIGGEAVVGYQLPLFDVLQPYAKAGIAGFAHEHYGTFHKYPQEKTEPRHFDGDTNTMGQNFSGMVIAAVFGGGVCAPMGQVELCGDVSRYQYVAQTANLLSDGMTIGTAVLKVALTGW